MGRVPMDVAISEAHLLVQQTDVIGGERLRHLFNLLLQLFNIFNVFLLLLLELVQIQGVQIHGNIVHRNSPVDAAVLHDMERMPHLVL